MPLDLSLSIPFWEEGCGSTQDIIDGPHFMLIKLSQIKKGLMFVGMLVFWILFLQQAADEDSKNKHPYRS